MATKAPGLVDQGVGIASTAWDAYSSWWWRTFAEEPQHVVIETFLILFILWLVFLKTTTKPYKGTKDVSYLTEREINELVEEWVPEPLVPVPAENGTNGHAAPQRAEFVVERVDGNLLTVDAYSVPLVNFASFDFLALAQTPEHKEAARQALLHYGCGSCGPRGFYGTFDVHLKIEQEMARFFGAEEGIMYSDAASAVTSAVAAFAKRGDIVLVDEACHEPIWTGVRLSRAHVHRFRHNDMDDLEAKLLQVEAEDRKLKRDPKGHRRFIVTEGLFKNLGDVCPLPRMVQLKDRFKYRLILDETFAFGVLGATGRGTCEHYSVPIESAEVVLASLAHTLGSVGGVCVGSTEVVDHQRLSGAGYVFSASAPPFVSSVAVKAIELLEAQPQRITELRDNIKRAQDMFKGLGPCGLTVGTSKVSPIQHYAIEDSVAPAATNEHKAGLLHQLQRDIAEKGIAVAVATYSELGVYKSAMPAPSLRVTLNARHTEAQIQQAVTAIHSSAKALLC